MTLVYFAPLASWLLVLPGWFACRLAREVLRDRRHADADYRALVEVARLESVWSWPAREPRDV